MKLLVIGNGFDLAHQLPTTYLDFLGFVERFLRLYNNIQIRQEGYLLNRERYIYQYMDELLFKKEKEQVREEFFQAVNNNAWINYFIQNPFPKHNWIDFESEISKVIQSIDKDMNHNIYGDIYSLSNRYLNDMYIVDFVDRCIVREKLDTHELRFNELRDLLLQDLKRLIRGLEIYLTDYVGSMEIHVKSPDIKDIEFDKVLSFNYTNTYEKLYRKEQQKVEFDYIHGKANLKNQISTNNMVLGIDEYLDKKRRNKEIEFIEFKKFYQRIQKETGCKYRDWVHEMKKGEGKGEEHQLYIFGHSLEITDRDVLHSLIMTDNVTTTIFYHNQIQKGQQIANLVKVIGQKHLIKKTGGPNQTIILKQQQDMILCS